MSQPLLETYHPAGILGIGGPNSNSAAHFFGVVRRLQSEAAHHCIYRQIANAAAVRKNPPGRRGPAWHSLRHTFAVRRLLTWYRAGADVRSLLPNLAVYLGHVGPTQTYHI